MSATLAIRASSLIVNVWVFFTQMGLNNSFMQLCLRGMNSLVALKIEGNSKGYI